MSIIRKFKHYAVVLFFLLFGTQSISQDSPNLSPYSCAYNHLFYLQEDSYKPNLSARSFSESIDSSYRMELAIQLKQIYDGKGLFVRLEAISVDTMYYDSIRNKQSYYPFPQELPQIYMARNQNGWFYSDETASLITNIHGKIYPFGSGMFLNWAPEKSNKKILGLFFWQYIGIISLLILTSLFFIIFRFILFFWPRRNKESNKKIWNAIKNLTSFWLSLQLLNVLLPILLLPVKIMENLATFLSIITSIIILIILLKMVKVILSYLSVFTMRTESKMDDQLLPIVQRSLQFAIIALWGLHFLTLLGVNITTLIAGISIGGLAIALAAQDTLKNLFGSITIFLDKPFQIGDWIIAGDVEGTIEEVGFRSTRIRSFANSVIYVPNSTLSNATVDNVGLRKFRRYKTTIGLTYNTPPAKIEAFIDRLRVIVEEHPHTKKDAYEIHLNNLGESAVEILFYVFFEVDGWTQELESKHQLLMSILRLAEVLEVNFAFPSRSIYLEDQSAIPPNN